VTREHFEAIAAAIALVRPDKVCPNPSNGMFISWNDCVVQLARVCADSNPRFDRDRFLKACGVGGGASDLTSGHDAKHDEGAMGRWDDVARSYGEED
jgi:hypothetical protein